MNTNCALILSMSVGMALIVACGGQTPETSTTQQEQTTAERLKLCGVGLFLAYQHVGRMPTIDEGLSWLHTAPSDATERDRWRGPYVQPEYLVDGWGRPLALVASENSPVGVDIRSLGADGVVSNDDRYSFSFVEIREAFMAAKHTEQDVEEDGR